MNDREIMAREGQGYPRWRRDMMMMMTYVCTNISMLYKETTIYAYTQAQSAGAVEYTECISIAE